MKGLRESEGETECNGCLFTSLQTERSNQEQSAVARCTPEFFNSCTRHLVKCSHHYSQSSLTLKPHQNISTFGKYQPALFFLFKLSKTLTTPIIWKKSIYNKKIKNPTLSRQPELNLPGSDGFILLFCKSDSSLFLALPLKKNISRLCRCSMLYAVAKSCTGSAQMVD